MLTRLKVGNKEYDAIFLLSLLQQALPGVSKPQGSGTLKDPWKPTTPSEWFYCAKQKPTQTSSGKSMTRFSGADMAWFNVGGRLIGIKAPNLYASDWGKVSDLRKDKNGDPIAPDKPVIADPTYTNIYRQMSSEGNVNDPAVTQTIRKLLKGDAVPNGESNQILPALTAVLFISEVARNHTAFHTALMLLDLVETGARTGQSASSFQYSWKNVLWCPDVIDGKLKGVTKAEYAAAVGDERTSQQTIQLGGETALPGGVAAMSHKGSAHGSAYDLTGHGSYTYVEGGQADPLLPITLVRRKEGTIVIRWLAEMLKGTHPNLAISVSAQATTFGPAYQGEADLKAGAAASLADFAYAEIGPLLQLRLTTFDKMIGAELKTTGSTKLTVEVDEKGQVVSTAARAVKPVTLSKPLNATAKPFVPSIPVKK